MKIFEFQKERSLDNIVEASFRLLRKHFKPMFGILWKYNAPIIVAFFASYFLYVYMYFGQFNRLMGRTGKIDMSFFSDPTFVVVMLAMILMAIIFYPRFYATIMGYIRVYKDNDGIVEPEKVNFYIKSKFWGLIGVSLLFFIIIFLFALLLGFLFAGLASLGSGGVALIFLVGIIAIVAIVYLSTTLSISFPIYFFEDTSVSGAISLSFKYIKEKWWFSFWTLFVIGLIIGLLGAAVEWPVSFYSALKNLSVMEEGDITKMVSKSGDIAISLLSVLSLIVQYILKVVYLIALSLLYFSLKEYHTQEGILSKIDQIGQKKEDEK